MALVYKTVDNVYEEEIDIEFKDGVTTKKISLTASDFEEFNKLLEEDKYAKTFEEKESIIDKVILILFKENINLDWYNKIRLIDFISDDIKMQSMLKKKKQLDSMQLHQVTKK